jgi:hypothetical protein
MPPPKGRKTAKTAVSKRDLMSSKLEAQLAIDKCVATSQTVKKKFPDLVPPSTLGQALAKLSPRPVTGKKRTHGSSCQGANESVHPVKKQKAGAEAARKNECAETVTEADDEKKSNPSGPNVIRSSTKYEGRHTRHILNCDANGVPADRLIRMSPIIKHTIRDQAGNLIPRNVIIRGVAPLKAALDKDATTQALKKRKYQKGQGGSHGPFPKPSPLRSSRVLDYQEIVRTKGKGAFHKKTRSAKVPMRSF